MVRGKIDQIKNIASSMRRRGITDDEIRVWLKTQGYDDERAGRVLNSIPKKRPPRHNQENGGK